MENGLEIKDSEKNLDPRGGTAHAPAPGHYTVYNHNIHRSYFLKPLGQSISESNFIGSICMRGEQCDDK